MSGLNYGLLWEEDAAPGGALLISQGTFLSVEFYMCFGFVDFHGKE